VRPKISLYFKIVRHAYATGNALQIIEREKQKRSRLGAFTLEDRKLHSTLFNVGRLVFQREQV
jgi:hypothetical protein